MRVMVLVSHLDDEVLGCGGYIPKLVEQGHEVYMVFLTDGILHPPKVSDNREASFVVSEMLELKRNHVYHLGLKNQRFDEYTIIDINKKIEALQIEPDMILTNSPTDANSDHQLTFNCALVIGRPIKKPVRLLTMELLSSSEWGREPFAPNFYVDITDTIERKIQAMQMYRDQVMPFPHPRSVEGIRYKAYARGMEVGYHAAEAYHIIRWFE